MVAGSIAVGDELLLGPLEGGCFSSVAVSSIHRSKVDVSAVQRGQHATLAVRQLEDSTAAGAGADPAAASEQQQQPQPEPLQARADSASCLHAWMQQTCSGPPELGRAGAPPSSAAVAIQGRHGAAVASSHSAAQLEGVQPPASPSADQLHHGWASSPQLAPAGSGPAPRPRKGAVLLDPSWRPQACAQFEAVLVLLGGHWPARGLLSGEPAALLGREQPVLAGTGSLGALLGMQQRAPNLHHIHLMPPAAPAGCYPPEGEQDEPDPLLLLPPPGGASGEGLAGSSFGGRSQSLGSCKVSR